MSGPLRTINAFKNTLPFEVLETPGRCTPHEVTPPACIHASLDRMGSFSLEWAAMKVSPPVTFTDVHLPFCFFGIKSPARNCHRGLSRLQNYEPKKLLFYINHQVLWRFHDSCRTRELRQPVCRIIMKAERTHAITITGWQVPAYVASTLSTPRK